LLKDYFILYKPRDIVSGDFYWINKTENKVIVIAADCTGHGVPGALMSMLGVAFLNEIVNKEKITSPAKILDRLRENIMISMKQQGENIQQRDGMDVAAICIDRENEEVLYSGANNPLYMIKNGEFVETKADKMPVSVYIEMKPFENKTFKTNKGDIIYLFSDGYADQFGGQNGKKLKYKAFKELLIQNSHLEMTEQKNLLDSFFNEWKGENPQIDDVLVMGIRL
jgi:serine phosphatase RsbU (regulator of sigma subunit)